MMPDICRMSNIPPPVLTIRLIRKKEIQRRLYGSNPPSMQSFTPGGLEEVMTSSGMDMLHV